MSGRPAGGHERGTAYRRRSEVDAHRRRKHRRAEIKRWQAAEEEALVGLPAAEPVGWGRKGRDGRVRPGGSGPS